MGSSVQHIWKCHKRMFSMSKKKGSIPQKKTLKFLEVQLMETEEELRKEREMKEEIKMEILKKENYWVKEVEKVEEERRAELRLYEALIREEVDKMKYEMKKQRDMLKKEADEKIKCLEQAMDKSREQWRQEREKLLMDLEIMRREHDHIEKQRLETEATWREHTESWALKTFTMMDMLENKTEEIKELKRMVERLQKEAEMKEFLMVEKLQISSGSKTKKVFRKLFQKKKIREKERMIEEIERLQLQHKENVTRQTRMADVMEDLMEEMDEIMKRSQAEKERMKLESWRERKKLMIKKKQECLKLKCSMRKSMEEATEAKVKELTETFQAEKERLAMELEKQTKKVEEEKKRCETIKSSWREHSDKLEQTIMEKEKLLKKRTKEIEVLKRTIEVQLMQKEQERRSVEEKELKVSESMGQRKDTVMEKKVKEDTEKDLSLVDIEMDMELEEDTKMDMEQEENIRHWNSWRTMKWTWSRRGRLNQTWRRRGLRRTWYWRRTLKWTCQYEMKKQRDMLKKEADEKIKCLEQAMDKSREQWRQEREKLLMDLEIAIREHDHIEKQRLETEATWREHTETWTQKTFIMMDMLENKTEEIKELKRMIDKCQKEAKKIYCLV